MDNISKAHKLFSERLNNPRVLSNPEEFLGPNYKTVLNFWLILEGLSYNQLMTIQSRYEDFYFNQHSESYTADIETWKASYETIGYGFANNASYAAWDVYGSNANCYATRELIGMHLLLDQQKPLSFFEMFLEVL